MNMRARTWEIVEAARSGDVASRVFDWVMLALIFFNVVAAVAGTVDSIQRSFGAALAGFELFSVVVFTVEYVVRVWSCISDERFRGALAGRRRYALTPMAIIDVLAIAPFYIPLFGADLRALRALRLFRIVRLAKIGRYYSSLRLMRQVMRERREELVLTFALMGILLVISSSVLYYCENDAQPESFSSIPATMWWSVATLTTVGYGDMYPVTAIGKVCASVIAVLGIGMFALPTGIIGAGFVDAARRRGGEQVDICPHCGKRPGELSGYHS